MKDQIIIKGAREHNLKNIDLKIPKGKLVVFTGVSGSGKSSLAMDTLYAEGQRRYVESLSAYARQFLGMMSRPEVDSIEGLSPAIAIDQHSLSHNPRSTVGTVTEIYDYLRVLFARIGHPHCPGCGQEVSRQTSVQITEQILNLGKDFFAAKVQKQWRMMILAPVVRDKRGEFSKLFANLEKKGFEHVRIDGQVFDLDEDLVLIKTNRHNIEVIVDKVALEQVNLKDKKTRQRLKDGVEIALDLADGLLILTQVSDPAFAFVSKPTQMKDKVYSTRFACPDCNLSLPEIEPRIFSFNSPFGACPECNGLGLKRKIDLSRVSQWRAQELERRYYTTTSEVVRQEIEKLMIKQICPACDGARLKKESLTVTINNYSIAQVTSWDLQKLIDWIGSLEKSLSSDFERQIGRSLTGQIRSRLKFLIAVGVAYLSLDRESATLSAGEGQRIRLASQVGSGLTGVLYILDEPTVGLHQRDIQKLVATLLDLRDLGNTLIVVEHDQRVISQADWLVDFGPGAGQEGGQIVASGSLSQLKANPRSLTGKYLAGKKKIGILPRQLNGESKWLKINGCSVHNLKKINVRLPLGRLICLTGVSGSGKSSLMTDTIYPAIKKSLGLMAPQRSKKYHSLDGWHYLERVYLVDQSPIGRTSRSNPSTYIGVLTDIRQLFALTREARLRGFSQTHFSFNTKAGRCEACEGQGQLRVQMQFLPDLWVKCEECQGKRYQAEVLEVDYKGKNIAQVLDLTIKEALQFYAPIPTIARKLVVLEKIGLGYLQLGQPSPTLSGGESQRLKLARELVKKSDGKTLYLLDEPTTGLHFDDLKKLILLLRALVARGDTVMVIEHNLDLVKQADWIIDLGPEGGEAGGYLVAQGEPEKIIKQKDSWTGRYLKTSHSILDRKAKNDQ